MLRPLLPLLLLLLACDDPRLRAVGPQQESIAEPEPEPEDPRTCSAPGPCYTAAYDAEIEACVWYPLSDGTACTAPCLENASCRAGHCEGASRSCDDGDACTRDACVAGTCETTGVACAVPADPCLAAVCYPETGCGTVPVADGVRCGVQGCGTRAVCMAGQCTQVEAADGDSCDGICTLGVCADGTCVEPEIVEPSWYLNTGRPYVDESGELVAITQGALQRVLRDGSTERVSWDEPQPFSSASAAHYGFAAGRWYWQHAAVTGLRATGIDGLPSWHLTREASPHPYMVVHIVLSDGAIVARVDDELWRITPDGHPVFLRSLCDGSALHKFQVDLLADERDNVYVAWRCEGYSTTRLASIHGELPLQPLLWQPPAKACDLAGAFAGRLVIDCAGQPLVAVYVPTGTAVELGDGSLGALAADTAYLFGSGLVRAVRVDDGLELWSRNVEASWPGCTPDFCTPSGFGGAHPTQSGTVLLSAGAVNADDGEAQRWVLEMHSDGTIARSCRLRDYGGYASPTRTWFAAGLWLVVGNDHFGLEAFELTGNPQLAPAWIGLDGGPAGGHRPWLPPPP